MPGKPPKPHCGTWGPNKMSDPAIAAMIREVLAEELEKLGGKNALRSKQPAASVREEVVSVSSTEELARFVQDILRYADDRQGREDIEQGRLVFRLAGSATTGQTAAAPISPRTETVVVSSGFFSERQVDQLPKGTKSVALGEAVRLTPLARDRLRHRGIKIERTAQ